jgi:hypothetical protein
MVNFSLKEVEEMYAKKMLSAIALVLFSLSLFLPALPTVAQRREDGKFGPFITSTSVEVKEFSGDFEQWGKSLTINSAEPVTFRWSTALDGVASAVWHVTDKPFTRNLPAVKVFAEGTLKTVPKKGHVSQFDINFAQFAPKTPPSLPLNYYVYVTTKNAQKQTIGSPSPTVKIVYQKSTQTPVKFDDDMEPKEPPKGIPADCQPIVQKIKNLQAQKQKLGQDLKETKSNYFTGEIKELQKQIDKLKAQLDQCVIKHGGKPDLFATFKGKVTITTNNSKAKGPFVKNITASVAFRKYSHETVGISFPPIVVGPFDTPVGDNTTTIKLLNGGGSFDPSTGHMTVHLHLDIHHSNDLAADSTLDITLSTTSPLDGAGKITLKGSAPFKDGYLDEDVCTLVITGTITPTPWT